MPIARGMSEISKEFQLAVITMTRVVANNSYKLDYTRCKLMSKMLECRERYSTRNVSLGLHHFNFSNVQFDEIEANFAFDKITAMA